MDWRQSWWEVVMGASLTTPKKYAKTSVLLLSWEDDHTDTESELTKLRSTLQTSYGFPVRYHRVHLHSDVEVQAHRYVTDFVRDEDGPGRLLIVYYAGHGGAGPRGTLLSDPPDKSGSSRGIDVDWIDVESTLRKALADVLVVLDCCSAGSMRRPPVFTDHRKHPGKFQYIAACEAGQKTYNGGNQGFTPAMIFALEKLARGPGFTTGKLVRTLTASKDFPRDEQRAIVFDVPLGTAREDIWIAPSAEMARVVAGAPTSPDTQRTNIARQEPSAFSSY